MAVKFQDYYQILGVAKTATTDEIKHAYRKLARQYHPDVNKTSEADKKFKEINEANEVLSDPDKRAKYDQLGSNWRAGEEFIPPEGYSEGRVYGGPGQGFSFRTGPGAGGAFSDFFETVFGGANSGGGRSGRGGRGFEDLFEQMQQGQGRGGRAMQEPQAVETEMTISLAEAMNGTTREIRLNDPRTGEGKTVSAKIPAGVGDGAKIRLRGAANGADLVLTVRLQGDERFTVEGHDLTTEVALAPWEAALGCKVDVPTVDGKVTLTIPPGTSSGKKMRLKGKGLARKGKDGAGEGGDLFVKVKIVVPASLTEEERKLFEELREKSGFKPRG